MKIKFARNYSMYEDPLPLEFAELDNRVNHVKQKTANEYSSSCPECGGVVHQNGEWPDRFRLWLRSDTTGGPFGWCRKCDYKWFPGKEEEWEPPDPAELERRAKSIKEQKELLEKEIAEAQAVLKKSERWLEYHENLTMQARSIWNSRGIPDDFINWWRLGYNDSFDLWRKENGSWESWWQSPTLTIPAWGHGWEIQNIKHRLLNLPNQPGEYRYRYEKSGMKDPPFICDPDKDSGPLFIAEGEIKSMVTYATIYKEGIQVAGIATKTPSDRTAKMFENYEPIWLCLDPDAYRVTKGHSAAERLGEMLGKERVRFIELPDKIDDLINMGALDYPMIKRLMNTARRAA